MKACPVRSVERVALVRPALPFTGCALAWRNANGPASNVNVAKGTAHTRDTHFRNLLQLQALDLAAMARFDIGSDVSFVIDARTVVVLV